MSVIGAERYLFTLEEFERMFDVDIFTEDDRIEFVEGELIRMSAVGGRHVRAINRATRTLILLDDSAIEVSVQNPLRISGRASFLPDIAVLRSLPGATTVPTADEVLVIIEVSQSSLTYDRDTKWSVS